MGPRMEPEKWKAVYLVEPYQLRIQTFQTVSFDRQKLGWQTEIEKADWPYAYRFWPLNKICLYLISQVSQWSQALTYWLYVSEAVKMPFQGINNYFRYIDLLRSMISRPINQRLSSFLTKLIYQNKGEKTFPNKSFQWKYHWQPFFY